MNVDLLNKLIKKHQSFIKKIDANFIAIFIIGTLFSYLQIFIFSSMSIAENIKVFFFTSLISLFLTVFYFLSVKLAYYMIVSIPVLITGESEKNSLANIFNMLIELSSTIILIGAIINIIYYPSSAEAMLADGFPPIHWLPTILGAYWSLRQCVDKAKK